MAAGASCSIRGSARLWLCESGGELAFAVYSPKAANAELGVARDQSALPTVVTFTDDDVSFTAPQLDRLRQSLAILSRTLTEGVVSFDSTEGKGSLLSAPTSRPSEVRAVTEGNVELALELAESLGRVEEQSFDIRAATEKLNALLTQGILKVAGRYRTIDGNPKYPYLPAAAIERYAADSFSMLQRSSQQARVRAAFSVWAIDLRGHLFADGCSKTATILSAVLLSRSGAPIPQVASRDQYYSAPYDSSGRPSWSHWLRYHLSSRD